MKKLFSIVFGLLLLLTLHAQDKATDGTSGASSYAKDPGPDKKRIGLIRDFSPIRDTFPIVLLDEKIIPYKEYEGFSKKKIRSFKRIQHLKGIESTAIYGSQAANGVIIITSKGFKTTRSHFYIPDVYGYFVSVEVPPSFPGGNKALESYLSAYITGHPLKKAIKGTTLVRFVINSNGKPIKPQVIQSLSPQADELSIKAVQDMPDWSPAKVYGEKVPVYKTVSIRFPETTCE